jgi:hypothetical protein
MDVPDPAVVPFDRLCVESKASMKIEMLSMMVS